MYSGNSEEHSLAESGSMNKTDIQEGKVDGYVRTILKRVFHAELRDFYLI